MSIKRFIIFLTLTISLVTCSFLSVYANTTATTRNLDGTSTTVIVTEEDKAKEKSAVTDMLTNMFANDAYTDINMQAGVQMATPFVVIIMTFSAAIVIVVCYMFFGVTAVDLAFIIIPPIRGFLLKKSERDGFAGGGSGKGSGGIVCISESARDAVEGTGGSGGGLYGGGGGGGRDRGVGSCLVTYATSRTGELVAFIIFVIIFFTGFIGKIILLIYRIFATAFEGILNIA